jgi:hypothetical protein
VPISLNLYYPPFDLSILPGFPVVRTHAPTGTPRFTTTGTHAFITSGTSTLMSQHQLHHVDESTNPNCTALSLITSRFVKW